ncbi:luciferase family protein [Streptacidiphilus sp. N1-3]|uniref:Luciferase family protein n=1 Tax=Streptacidiphilus alkalitolerans TaxID=3342712 RepID=A0ABV6WVN3_9ACTN
MKAACRAWEQLESWSDLTNAPASCGQGRALVTGASEIVHLHNDHDADLHLTHEAIERLQAELEQSTAVRLHPGTDWITLHLDCDRDAELMVSLVSVALQAHARPRPESSASPCNRGHITILPSAGPSEPAPRRAHLPRLGRRLHGPRTV